MKACLKYSRIKYSGARLKGNIKNTRFVLKNIIYMCKIYKVGD